MFIKVQNPRISKSQHSSYLIQYTLKSHYFVESLILEFSVPQIYSIIIQVSLKTYHNNKSQTYTHTNQTQKSITWNNVFSIAEFISIDIKIDQQIQIMSQLNGSELLEVGIVNTLIQGWDLNEPDYQKVYKNHSQILTISNTLKSIKKNNQYDHLIILIASSASKVGKKQQAYDLYSMIRKRHPQSTILRLIVLFNELYLLGCLCRQKQSNKFINQMNKMVNQSEISQYCKFLNECLDLIQIICQSYSVHLQGYLGGLGLFLNHTQIYGQWLPQLTEKLLSPAIIQLLYKDFFVNGDQFIVLIYVNMNDDELEVSTYYCQLLLNCILKNILVELCSKKDMNELSQNSLIIFLLKIAENLIKRKIEFQLSLQIWFNLLQIALNNQQLRQIPYLIVENVQYFDVSQLQFQAIFSRQFDQYEILLLTSRLIFKACLETLTPKQIIIVRDSLISYSLLSSENMEQTIRWVQITQKQQFCDCNVVIHIFLNSQKLQEMDDSLFQRIIQNLNFIDYLKNYLQSNHDQQEIKMLLSRCYHKFITDCKGIQALLILGAYADQQNKIKILKSIVDEPINFSFNQNTLRFLMCFSNNKNLGQTLNDLININLLKVIKNTKELSQVQEFRRQILADKIYKILVVVYLYPQDEQFIQLKINSQTIYTILEKGKATLWNKYYEKLYVLFKFLEPNHFYQQIKILKDMDTLNLLLLISNQRHTIKSIVQNNDLMISIKSFMDHSHFRIQLLAILLFLYLLRPESKYFQGALKQLVHEKIKKHYLKIRFGEEIIQYAKKLNGKQKIIDNIDGLKTIQSHISQNIEFHFRKQLAKPKIQVIGKHHHLIKHKQTIQIGEDLNYNDIQTNQMKNLQIQDSLDKVEMERKENRKRTPIQNLQEYQLSLIEQVEETSQKKDKKFNLSPLKKKKHKVDLKESKCLAVKLTTAKNKKSQNKNYYIGLKDLKKQWFRTMNSIHQRKPKIQ